MGEYWKRPRLRCYMGVLWVCWDRGLDGFDAKQCYAFSAKDAYAGWMKAKEAER